MNRLSITRRLGVWALKHPDTMNNSKTLQFLARTLPKGYRKITKK